MITSVVFALYGTNRQDCHANPMSIENDLRQSVELIADQLCKAVDGTFDFRVSTQSSDPTVEKLQMLINFMLDSAERSVQELEQQSDELQQQVELAQAASLAKADFLANMSHEIRTPLNGIVGLTALLQQSNVDNEQADLVNGVRISSDNLLAIINDILDFSKIEAGKLELETVDFNLYSMVQEVAESQAARAAQKGLELVVRYVPNTPTHVRTDESRLRQVLINLVGNALKFTERGHVMISVNYDQGLFQFEVEDTGIGIPPDRRDCLFDEFTQADTSTTRRFGGTGLGLAISKRIVEVMNGQMSLRSQLGSGSVFAFEIPMTPLENATPAPLPTRPVEKMNLRVLIVDDNQLNRFVLHEQLLHWGIEAETAISAQQGLRLILEAQTQNNPYDLAIIDYAMPNEDGISLANKIKQSSSANTRLLLLSSLGKTFPDQELIDQGFSGYLLKPAPQDLIKDMLRVLCAGLDGEDIPPLITRQALTGHRYDSAWKYKDEPVANLRILVAEDNVVNQKVARALLEKMGCQVYMANNGSEALDIAQRFAIDLVLMDMQMPEMNGIEATEHLRASKLERLRELPIIALTANATSHDREKCLQAGMNDFLSKPFKPDVLQHLLSKWTNTSTAKTN